jgi:DNA invertase Pin-like site-specific DNA recombinase
MRFAPIIRVSTESQKSKGESLRTQTTQITQYVESLKGAIPESCWIYSGQEHATPDQERAKLDQLLKDSAKDKFDAVIVCDSSRWSRDNQKSKAGLEILRNHGIRFFVGTMEFDLFNPEHAFILGMSAEIGEYQARIQALKSIVNRIERAKRGIPSSGKLPYGRTFDKETGKWGLDPEKHKNIQWAAERYLEGDSVVHLAKILDMNWTNLWKILSKRSGPEWICNFTNKKVNVNETVTMQIPPLLDPFTIERIHDKAVKNKTYVHGQRKYKYLLSSFIFCQDCGYALMGQANHGDRLYYRHPLNRAKKCQTTKWVQAQTIENAVLALLFNTFGDVEKIKQAVERAIPNMDELNQFQEEHDRLKQTKSEILKEREKLIGLAAKGILNEKEVATEIKDIRERLGAIETRLDQVAIQLSNRPDPEKVKRRSSMARKVMVDVAKSKTALRKMTWARKRKLIQHAFDGKDDQGNRMGVYVRWNEADQNWDFEIRGILETIISGNLPKGTPDLESMIEDDTMLLKTWCSQGPVLP